MQSVDINPLPKPKPNDNEESTLPRETPDGEATESEELNITKETEEPSSKEITSDHGISASNEPELSGDIDVANDDKPIEDNEEIVFTESVSRQLSEDHYEQVENEQVISGHLEIMQDQDHDVVIITNIDQEENKENLEEHGFRTIPIQIEAEAEKVNAEVQDEDIVKDIPIHIEAEAEKVHAEVQDEEIFEDIEINSTEEPILPNKVENSVETIDIIVDSQNSPEVIQEVEQSKNIEDLPTSEKEDDIIGFDIKENFQPKQEQQTLSVPSPAHTELEEKKVKEKKKSFIKEWQEDLKEFFKGGKKKKADSKAKTDEKIMKKKAELAELNSQTTRKYFQKHNLILFKT